MQSCHVRWLFAFALAALPTTVRAQDATGAVRGRVTDATTSQPLPGVTIAVDGTQLGALTGDQGEYSIPAVPAGRRTLRVRRIGFSAETRAVDVAAGQTTTADFALRGAAVALEEVVVTGTAAPTTRRALGTSIAAVDSNALRNSQAVSIDQALQGKIAGAQITQNSGNPGGGGITVRLRGTSSFISGSDPLYIVDGVIVDNSSAQLRDLGARGNVQNRLADLNPGDIERIEVIRGAAAAALYGSRANNGVVQIFTKRGRPGRARVGLLTRYSSNELRRELGFNDLGLLPTGLPTPRFDYQDDIFRRGQIVENNLSVDGGNDQTTYYFGGSWTEEDGILRATGASRKSARLNLTQFVTPKLKVDLGTNYVNNSLDALPNGEANGVITAVVFEPTQNNLYPQNGVYPFSALGPNPFLAIDRFKYPQQTDRFIGSLRARYTPLPYLAFDYTLGYDGYQQDGREFFPRGAFAGGNNATGLAASVVRNSRILNQDGVATITVRPAAQLELGTSVGVNYTEQEINTTTASSFNVIPVSELVNGSIQGAAQNQVELVTLGFYGQQTLAWRDRMYLTGALRWDASSTFGENERWQLFPKLSASYVISEEPWFAGGAPGRVFSSARLRAALGYAGNQPSVINAYQRYDDYVSAQFDAKAGLINSVTLGNADLEPERQREFELGADVGFLTNRVSLEATYYDKLNDGLLFFRPVAPSTGYTRQFSAIGQMSNTGVELLLRTINVERPRLGWESTFTYTRNRNRVDRLDIPAFQSASGYPNRIAEGEPVGIFYGAYALQHCQTGAFLLDSIGRLRPSTSVATAAAREALSGGQCNAADQRKLGDPNPDWLGSMLNEVRVGRKLRLRLLLDGSFGNDVMNLTGRLQDLFVNSVGSERELLPYGDPRKLPTGYSNRQGGIFGQYVEDGSFVKLREVSATYTLNVPSWGRLFSEGVDLTLSGRNLYTWTDYSGFDPEVNLFGQTAERTTGGQTAADRGFDFATYPIPRTWSVSARFTY
jgi:TonB-dependent SusC/RagA subfamily outer membrane receptor